MPDSHDRLDALIAELLNETATPDELVELEELLKSDEDARRRYVHHFDLHSELEQRAERGGFGVSRTSPLIRPSGTFSPRGEGTAQSPLSLEGEGRGEGENVQRTGHSGFRAGPDSHGEPPNPLPEGRGDLLWVPRLRVGLPVALAVAALLIAAFVWARPETSDHIATLVAVSGPVQLTADGGSVVSNLQVGQILNGGTFECSSLESSATLQFVDGSTLNIGGNSIVTVSDREQKVIRLREGNISAEVKPQPVGQPFRVFTPTAELEVKGTRFDVLASSSETKLAVREGVVRAKRVADGESIDVPADHATVATVEASESLVSAKIKQPATTWTADLEQDTGTGKWVPIEILERIKLSKEIKAGQIAMEDAKKIYFERLAAIEDDHKGAVFAMPKPLGKSAAQGSQKSAVLYLIVFDVARRQAGPVVLDKDSCIRFRGEVSQPTGVRFGFAARDAEGAGKRWAKPERIEQVNEVFELVIPVADFMTGRDASGKATRTLSTGWELTHVYCMAKDATAKLRITHVELMDTKP